MFPNSIAALSHLCIHLAPAIANHLWQSTWFAVVAALLTLMLRGNQARIRYWLWLTASLKFFVPFALLIGLGGHLAKPHLAAPVAQNDAYFAMQEASQPFTQISDPVASPIAPSPVARNPFVLPPAFIALAWLAGFTLVLMRWCVRWHRVARVVRASSPIQEGREIDALRRLQSAAGLRAPIRLLLSPASLEPGIFGLGLRAAPVLAWPAGISPRLTDAHLEAILAHEVAHVRRRDNLTAALHMLVEAVFWFHPAVWGIGARLVAERERACDEEVLQLCNRPEVYAESILKVCEFCVESPLACVSGITGADLKHRIVQIMSARIALRLTLPRKLLLLAAALLAGAVPIVFGQIKAAQRLALIAILKPISSPISMEPLPPLTTLLSAAAPPVPLPTPAPDTAAPDSTSPDEKIGSPFQVAELPSSPNLILASASQAPQTPAPIPNHDPTPFTLPKFDVVSVRRTKPGATYGRFDDPPEGDGITITNITLRTLILSAYEFHRPDMLFGLPDWASIDSYDIQAKVAPEDIPLFHKMTQAQRGYMLEELLEDRFNMKIHREMKETPIYALVVAKGGSKMHEVPQADVPAHLLESARNFSPASKDRLKDVTLADFTKQLGSLPNGHFYGLQMQKGPGVIAFYARTMVPFSLWLSGMNLGRAVQDQTGLTGNYDFTLEFNPAPLSAQSANPNNAAPLDTTGPDIFTALQQQAGLKLEPAKGLVQALIVDHVERPAEN